MLVCLFKKPFPIPRPRSYSAVIFWSFIVLLSYLYLNQSRIDFCVWSEVGIKFLFLLFHSGGLSICFLLQLYRATFVFLSPLYIDTVVITQAFIQVGVYYWTIHIISLFAYVHSNTILSNSCSFNVSLDIQEEVPLILLFFKITCYSRLCPLHIHTDV